MEEIKVRELPETDTVDASDYMIVEDEDGTKKVLARHFRSLVLTSLFFDNIEDLKNTPRGLKEGDICTTLGYYTPGDCGGAKYRITYNPAAIEDKKTVHYLSYSDTLRAELILEDTEMCVNQFGAKGDGKTDDYDAIQAAIDICSGSKVITFVNGSNYLTRKPINIYKDYTIIDGKGATISPQYCDGFNICKSEDSTSRVIDITVKDIVINAINAINGIKVQDTSLVTFNNCFIHAITSNGIYLKNTRDVHINDCEIAGKAVTGNEPNGIVLDGDNTAIEGLYSTRHTYIKNSVFIHLKKSVYLLSPVPNSTENIFMDSILHYVVADYLQESYLFYAANSFELVKLSNIQSKDSSTLVYIGGAASRGQITCDDIYVTKTKHVFDLQSNSVVLCMNNNIKVNSGKIFKNMNSKVYSSVPWDMYGVGATFETAPIGELHDSVSPCVYDDKKGYSISGSTLTLSEIRNMHVDWSNSTSNVNTIANGVKGQLLYIKSSTNKSIVAVTNKIVLSASSIQLSAYKGILLRYDGLKWIQVQ